MAGTLEKSTCPSLKAVAMVARTRTSRINFFKC
jgi:hypothetical protein